ncbi:stage II sporulation protein D [Pseudoflavonifractor gallinarum]|uniref:stage II sporulation protein D n=1 Tax=Pseudoflavonifractor gallinarum TaxID=2779352 RepID=UPI0036F236CF
MKQVAATALILLLLFFLLPLLLLRGDPLQSQDEDGSLPLDHTVVSPVPSGELDTGTQIQVQLSDGTVSTMSMGDYLWNVVAAEMPASFELEALKAQAVAARTYAMRKMEHPSQAHPDADVCTDHTCCQAYIEPEQAASNWGENADVYTAKIRAAVAGTDGVVAKYNGQLIDAVFFSSAAGKTVDAVEVWGNSVPYLTSVESPEGEEVPNYHSTVEVSAADFKTKFLAAHPDAVLEGDPSSWFGAPQLNSAGGVESISVGGVSTSGNEMRTLFALRSTSFTISTTADTITFSVTGYGHGVGMSQYGANAMAKEGKTYEEILTWYYTGIELTTEATA